MPGSIVSRMNKNISDRIRQTLRVHIFLILIVFWGWEIKSYLETLEQKVDLIEFLSIFLEDPLKLFVTIIGLISWFISELFRDIDFYNRLDRWTHALRDEVYEVIACEIQGRLPAPISTRKYRHDSKRVMDFFYLFINEEAATRETAFSYWEDYFANVGKTAISLFLYFCTFVTALESFDRSAIPSLLPAVFLALFLNSLFATARLREKILRLPQQQISEVFAKHKTRFENEAASRFP
jgi:hypothetical protein